MSRDTPLRLATVIELVEELGRKLNAQHQGLAEPPPQWCDDCKFFKHRLPGEVGPDRNPCLRKHKMDFYVPQAHDSPETFGYFRLVCADRTDRPESG